MATKLVSVQSSTRTFADLKVAYALKSSFDGNKLPVKVSALSTRATESTLGEVAASYTNLHLVESLLAQAYSAVPFFILMTSVLRTLVLFV